MVVEAVVVVVVVVKRVVVVVERVVVVSVVVVVVLVLPSPTTPLGTSLGWFLVDLTNTAVRSTGAKVS